MNIILTVSKKSINDCMCDMCVNTRLFVTAEIA